MNELLDRAIATEGGVGKLAVALGVRQSVVSNWRARGLPKPWSLALRLLYDPNRLARGPAASAAPPRLRRAGNRATRHPQT
jgi:hypothetical protein